MMLKYSQYQKRSKLGASGKPQRCLLTGSSSKKIAASKGHRKGKGAGNKKLNGHRVYSSRSSVSTREEGTTVIGGTQIGVPDPCDNSNDSGLGFDHSDSYQSSHHHPHHHSPTTFTSWGGGNGGVVNNAVNERTGLTNGVHSSSSGRGLILTSPCGIKRPRLIDIKIESDDANDNFTFPHLQQAAVQPSLIPQPSVEKVVRRVENNAGKVGKSIGKRANLASGSNSVARSRDLKIQLEIVSQPETQHRARYQTEGSRGAVKDTTGNSFPLVKLTGYEGVETALLQVYIGTDQGKVAPHMFYQACKVSGKNSTPCVERKLNGTVVIEIEFNPSKDMLILCDCVGILKERNVDVEHRFPEENQTKSRKKSTRCRMVFRTTVTLEDGSVETLQVTSHPIVCTQPPGVPEICKKSLSSCPANGGVELFIIGKNFLKDTRIRFSEGEPTTQDYWEYLVQPDKEYLHQSHLVCSVPRYRREDLKDSVAVSVSVISGGKASEAVPFLFTPLGTYPSQTIAAASTMSPPYVMAPNLSSETQSLVTRIPDVQFSPQKILIVPSGMELSGVSCLPSETKVLKEESSWMKNESVDMSLLSNSSVLSQANDMVLASMNGPSLLQSPTGSVVSGNGNNVLQSTINASPQPIQQQSSLSSPGGLMQTSSLHSPSSNIISPASQVDAMQSPILANSAIMHSPQGSLIQPSPDHTTNQSIMQSNLVDSSSLINTQGLLHTPTMVESSPVLSSSLTSRSPTMSQSSPLVESSSMLQTPLPTSPNVLQAQMKSPTLIQPSMNSSTTLIPSGTIVDQCSIIQSNVMPKSSTIISSPSLVDSSSMGGLSSPTIDSANMLQASSIVESSALLPPSSLENPRMLSNSNVRDGSSLLEPSNIVDSSSMLPPSNLVETGNLIQNTTSIVEPSNMIAHSRSVGKNHSIISSASIVESPNMIQSNMVESTNLLSGNNIIEADNIIQNNNIVESTNLMQNSSTGIVDSSRSIISNSSLISHEGNVTPSNSAMMKIDPSIATIEKFVSTTPLPALSVETYLSHIENKSKYDPPLLTTCNERPISLKQMVVAAAAAALDIKTSESQFHGKNIDNMKTMIEPYQNGENYYENGSGTIYNGNSVVNTDSNSRVGSNIVHSEVNQCDVKSSQKSQPNNQTMPVPHELTAMSENDLISYINPSCFDQV